jgi:hypothetical protein
VKHILIAATLALAIPAAAFAQAEKSDPGSLSDKAMKDQPGNSGGGSTAAPTAKPADGSLPDKAMKDNPGTKGGETANPTADTKSGSLPDAAKKE